MAVAVVTGASRGIGLAVAERLARDGHSVALVARSAEDLEEAAGSLRAAVPGAEVAVAPANLRELSAPREVFDRAEAMLGPVGLLVNNAGVNNWVGPLAEYPADRLELAYAVNLRAPLLLVQELVRRLPHEGHGVVVNMASIAGLGSEPFIGWYGTLKSALLHMTRELAAELGPRVRVNAVSPGLVRTRFAEPLVEAVGAELERRLPARRLGEPEDVARAVSFLCSEEASWVTGANLVIDGGNQVLPLF